MSAERFTLDTNILIYAVDAREGRKRELAARIVEAAAGFDCPLALQVVGEFYAAGTAKLKLNPKDAAARRTRISRCSIRVTVRAR
jgi:predicted nucleic acid-binding protein